MVVEHAHGLRQRRGPNAKSSLHKAHLAPDAGLQAPGASLSFAQGSHDFESLDRGIGRGDRSEERRVGKECGSTSRSRWSPSNSKTNNTTTGSVQLTERLYRSQ